jgi:hypothetical protein
MVDLDSFRNMHPRKLAGASVVAVVIVLVVNIGLSTAIFGGTEYSSLNPSIFGSRTPWRELGSQTFNPYQHALSQEQRSWRDEWVQYNPYFGTGRPSLKLRAWSGFLIFGSVTGLGGSYLWRRARKTSDFANQPDLTYVLLGLGITQGVVWISSLLLIRELGSFTSRQGILSPGGRDGSIDSVRTMLAVHDAILFISVGLILAVSMILVSVKYPGGSRTRNFTLMVGGVLVASVGYYMDIGRDVLAWGYVAGTATALALLIHAGVEFVAPEIPPDQ